MSSVLPPVAMVTSVNAATTIADRSQETRQTPLQQYHARLSQHLNALLSSTAGARPDTVAPPDPSSSHSSAASSASSSKGAQTHRPVPMTQASSSHTTTVHASSSKVPTPPTAAAATPTNAIASSSAPRSRHRRDTASSRSRRSSHPSRSSDAASLDVHDDPPSDPELTARPDRHPPILAPSSADHSPQEDSSEASVPPPLVHQLSSSRSGTTEAIPSPQDPLSPPTSNSPVEQKSKDTPNESSGNGVELDQFDSREEEHRRAWKSDGARVWKSIPTGFKLSLDKRSRRSSDGSRDGAERESREGIKNDRSGLVPSARSPLPPSSLSQESSPGISPGQKSFISSPHSHQNSAKLHSTPEFRITNDPDLAAKMGLIVSTPPVPTTLSPPKYSYGKTVSHIQPVPVTKPDVLADINGRLKLPLESSSKQVPRSGTGKAMLDKTGNTPPLPSGPTVVTLGPAFSVPRSKLLTPDATTPKERAMLSPSTSHGGKRSKQQKIDSLKDIADHAEEADTEYHARREQRLKRREADLNRRVRLWASAVNIVDRAIPDIDPTPPSPSLATAQMMASPLVPVPQTPVHERSKLSFSVICDAQSTATSSSTKSSERERRRLKTKKSRESLHKRSSSPVPQMLAEAVPLLPATSSERQSPLPDRFVLGHAPRPSLKGSMFTYSTSFNDSHRRMRAIDALLGDMSLRGTNLNPSSSTNTFNPGGSTMHLGAFGTDSEDTPRRASQSKEAPSSLNPQTHSRLSSQERKNEERPTRAREIMKLTEFSESFDLVTGAGLGNGHQLRKSNWEVRCGMPTPRPRGAGVMSYADL
ncbi:hypothetical protein BD324DRAFT_650711 [Kockovaella imperatae]|uniref:Uncharacterized protein n=1 Tax=Kockovaella imperatae TaxID=4999 RepID=A0A1Y1UHT0_9TREE|nr:hypothetical protein BD324DRAFT_650711 [Kockovaella imperatae]ORX37097.1 hypothetical protein BD324DRAFT_650711 [Kockovaella imperatae]